MSSRKSAAAAAAAAGEGPSTGKRRGRPPKSQSTTMERPKSKFQYHLLKKPKYLCKDGADSRFSTPSASRASSPQGSEESRPSSSRRRPAKTPRSAKSASRGRASTSRGRAVSGRKSYTYHESEYHYGSDFGDDSDKSDAYDDSLRSASESEDSLANESDSDFSIHSFGVGGSVCQKEPSPDPIWLQEREYPPLELPGSSDDLLVSNSIVLKATAIYEIIRRFRHLVRLSPFRLEDFCAAITCDDESPLLMEIHIMLLKAVLREEDSQQTHFAPLDQKDSVNIALYLIDCVTWPEVLRSYIESDSSLDQNVLNVLNQNEYPFVAPEKRLQVLQFLTDQFLITTTVRDDMLQEGPIHYDDHCRICHRLGDLLCCETCPAVFHLECVDPPLEDVPSEDWQCNLCKLHKVSGVMDCISNQEKQGMLCRQELLGYDRHGRKYWFIARRVFIETADSEEVWYFSTVKQFEHLLSKLDPHEYETNLYKELDDKRDEIIRQMTITENITNQHKGNKKSYIEVDNQRLAKLLANPGIEQDESMDVDDANSESREASEKSQSDANGGDSSGREEDDSQSGNDKHITRLKTGSITPRTLSAGDVRRNNSITKEDDSTRVTRHKLSQLSNGTLYFKLGMDNGFKTYVNQYSSNPIALNKPQRNEERDKKRHLSHKFSLTQASEFKWLGGGMYCSQAQIVSTIKQTIIALEQSIASPFLHQNWAKLRKTWINAISTCTRASDFARIICILQACMRGVVFASVWHEQLGHSKMCRITSAEREEKKKLEKREKRERDDEEERNRMTFNFVKYSLGLKHQVWKQKGEEYRIHGQWDWVWLSYGRRKIKTECGRQTNEVGHVLVPIVAEVHKQLLKLDVRTFEAYRAYLNGSKELDFMTDNEAVNSQLLEKFNQIESFHVPDSFGTIDVSKALSTPGGRVLYPKIARKASVLDGLLQRRMDLKEAEERKFSNVKEEEDDIEVNVIQKPETRLPKWGTCAEKQLQAIINYRSNAKNLNQDANGSHSGSNTDQLNSVVQRILPLRDRYKQMEQMLNFYRCYSLDCVRDDGCFSPMCVQRRLLKEELLPLLKTVQTLENTPASNTASGGAKSILEQKLTENKSEDFDDMLASFTMNRYRAILDDWESAHRNLIQYDEQFVESMAAPRMEDEHNNNISNEVEIKAEEAPDLVVKEEIVSTDNDVHLNGSGHRVDSLKMNEESSNSISENSCDEPKLTRRGRPRSNKHSLVTVDEPVVKVKEELIIPPKREHKPNRRFALPSRSIKKEEPEEKEMASNGSVRVFSVSSTKGKIYLSKNLAPETKIKSESKASAPVKPKYPAVNYFRTRKQTTSMIVLPRNELMKLGRIGGRLPVAGFHHMAKNNNTVWPYPCARPLFKTCWLYRTLNANTLSAIGLQLRIIWTCLRWDDMAMKPVTTDGKHQVTTESEIMSLEILKHRYVGVFNERMQYLRRKVVIPLELPKTVREVQSIRSGLRKRKRAESPQQTEPQVSEEWIDEDKLELWEIKLYGEKQEKLAAAQVLPITRTSTGKLPPTRHITSSSGDSSNSSTPTSNGNSASGSSLANKSAIISSKASREEITEKMEQQLRLQRAAHNQKRAMELKQQQDGATPPKQSIVQRRIIVKNPDGTTKIIQQNITQSSRSASASTSQPNQRQQSPAPAKPDGPQKVQIIRGPDGKVSVRGLNPGQQLIQTPDGKLHVLSAASGSNSTAGKQAIATKVGQKIITKVATGGGSTSGATTVASASPVTTTSTVQSPPPQASVQQTVASTATATATTQQIVNKPSNIVVRNQAGQPIKQIIQKQVVQKVQATSTTTQQQSPPPQKIIINNSQGTVQKIISTGGQLLATAGSPVQKVVSQSNLQQLLQGTGQKVIVEQNPSHSPVQTQKVLLATTAAGQTVQKQILIQNANTGTPQQIIINQAGGQKVVQQIVATPGQQIMIGGQRIILNPGGQKIISNQPIQIQQTQQVQQAQQPQKVQQVHQLVTTQQATQQPQQIQIQIQQPVAQQQLQSQVQTIQTQPATPLSQGQSLAQQLSSGKLQLANLNGQQVLIRPLGNNQAQVVAHIKTQPNGTAQIIPLANAVDPPTSTQPQSQQQVQQVVQSAPVQQTTAIQQVVQQPLAHTTVVQQTLNTSGGSQTTFQQIAASPQQHQPDPVEQTLLQGQPPGTVIKCVTAQVIQTQQGPRIVLQGLQGSEFTPQQSALVQQQVKQQLLKAQESNGKQGVLGPTKIYLAIQPSQQQQAVNAQPPPLAPVQIKHDGGTTQIQLHQQADSTVTTTTPTMDDPELPAPGSLITTTTTIKTAASTSSNDNKPQILSNIVINGGNTAVINPMVKKELQKVLATNFNRQNLLTIQGQLHSGDQLDPTGEGPTSPSTKVDSISERDANKGSVEQNDSFVVTPDYIQQTIKNALKQENLNPEIEEKLLNLQRYQEKQMKTDDRTSAIALQHNYSSLSSSREHVTPVKAKKRPCRGEDDDDEWMLDTPKRRPTKSSGSLLGSIERKPPVLDIVPSSSRMRTVSQSESVSPTAATVTTTAAAVSPVCTAKDIGVGSFEESTPGAHVRSDVGRRNIEKKKQQQSILQQQQRQNKLQVQIQKELSVELAARCKQEQQIKQENSAKHTVPVVPATSTEKCGSLKRKTAMVASKENNQKTQKHTINTSKSDRASKTNNKRMSKKKEKIYCLCRKPYDETKFYVGCDLCNNWFHGDCVGISEEQSKEINEFICSECKHARETQELYCLCKQPYDESQFYICCDKCQDWFHGRCVGILQSEAEYIDEYICPNCQINNSVNFANMKTLSIKEFENLKKLIKQIQQHKSAWPFMEPVDPDEAPDYYRVIKEPMDLQKVESKVNSQTYNTLSEFIGDMTKIFDNCRYYNPKESQFYRCAESLESFFVQKIKFFRENLVDKKAGSSS
ncbi:nucleosome-remodeling factor subunit NURF301 isoform X2 [Toxorhynchites rutilus septentrionalis]|uniref:nucleosome-remodeling factor subunit NURF301 isoform X2 n=1 Tax=Toxorhynchites rutilus septentrionalis TaxID=329112 RepID=UPI0024790A57|nr:nucleosome-remodeling factor subunit NURF301 isoform X2 [Toxorhynchites rutilus septentrionalis]